MSTVRVPKMFYDDHVSRALPTPPIVRETTRHYHIDAAHDEGMADLLSDARYYSDCAGGGWDFGHGGYALGLQSSARATARALNAHGRAQVAPRMMAPAGICVLG